MLIVTFQSEGPPKPRQTWSNSEDSHDIYNKKPIVKRRTAPSIPPPQEEPQESKQYFTFRIALILSVLIVGVFMEQTLIFDIYADFFYFSISFTQIFDYISMRFYSFYDLY